MMTYVTTNDNRRKQRWQHIFGTDRLPVRYHAPRLQETRSGARMAYDLDVARLHDMQVRRLAAYLAHASGVRYADVLVELRATGWPITANEVEVVAVDVLEETAVARQRPFYVSWIDQLLRRLQPAA